MGNLAQAAGLSASNKQYGKNTVNRIINSFGDNALVRRMLLNFDYLARSLDSI